MSIQQNHIIASSDRIIGLVARSDLQISQSTFQGEVGYIVKDPLAMKYFQCRVQELRVLQMLTGRSTYRDIQTSLELEFPASRVPMDAIVKLIFHFHQSGLLLSTEPGQATRLAKRQSSMRRSQLIGKILNPFTIRFPGVDPSPLLRRLDPLVGWLFTKVAVSLSTLLVLAALLLILVNWQEVRTRLPEAQAFFAFDNLIQMGFLLMFTKTIHELGHALCCRRLGGECHEFGLLLMVLTPAMYCNTSDSWIMPNKWHRIAIGAAGMYVEIILAAISTFVWWYSEPGWVHYTALNLMFLSSIATLLFNANPLLRYDGYFILADLLEMPNLAQKARRVILETLKTICLGIPSHTLPLLPNSHRGWFIGYSITSFFYRWFVTVGVLWFVTNALQPYGLAVIGHGLVLMALAGMLIMPTVQFVRYLSVPGRLQQVKALALVSTGAIITAIATIVVFVPLPHHVSAVFVVEPHEAERIYVNAAGSLVQTFVVPGQNVEPGTLLARLDNPKLQLDLLALEGEHAKLLNQLEQLELTLKREVDVSHLIVQTRSELHGVEAELDAAKRMLKQLELRTNRGGTILPAKNVVEPVDQENSLVAWSGCPLDRANVGCFLQRETQYCYVGDLAKWEVRLFVDQSDAALLSPGQQVDIKPNSSLLDRYRLEITSVSRNEIDHFPRELSHSNGGPLAVKLSSNGEETPMMKTYESKAMFVDAPNASMLVGMQGKAKIHVGERTIGSRLWRFFHSIFHFS